jgi:hypothetical protein
MSGNCSIRYAAIATLGVLAILCGQAGAAPPSEAADVLEVKVLDAQVDQGQGEPSNVLYSMEVVSVVRSASRVQPGETITVRSYGQGNEVRARGWVGTAYLDPDPKAAGTGRQFVAAAPGESLVNLPPAPPSFQYTIEEPPKAGQ